MRLVPIGVVIVNWNGCADTVACLESLAKADPRPASIVVVDNGSTDDSVATLTSWAARHPAVRISVVADAMNRGFAGGCNVGIARLVGDSGVTHYLLLNNDATVERAFFAELAAAAALVPNAGIFGVTIYETAPRGDVWYAGGRFLRARSATTNSTSVPRNEVAILTEFVTGCAMLISRPAWTTVGPLPECYFMYFEDAEYCLRARAAGLPVLYAPRAVVRHAVSATVRRAVDPPRNEYWFARARALFARRNFRGWEKWATLAYLALTVPPRAAIKALRRGPRRGWGLLWGTIRGLLAVEGRTRIGQRATVQDRGNRIVVGD